MYEMKYVKCLNYQNCERIWKYSLCYIGIKLALVCGTFQSSSGEHPMIMRIETNDINVESFTKLSREIKNIILSHRKWYIHSIHLLFVKHGMS